MNDTMVIRVERMPGVTEVVNFDEALSAAACVIPDLAKELKQMSMNTRMESNEVRELVMSISATKIKLLEATTTYINGVVEAFSRSVDENETADSKKRLKYSHDAYVEQCKKYQKELSNFHIRGISSVFYRGYEHSRNEPVRRLSEIHLEALQEDIRNFKSPSVMALHKEYEVLIQRFISLVRMYVY